MASGIVIFSKINEGVRTMSQEDAIKCPKCKSTQLMVNNMKKRFVLIFILILTFSFTSNAYASSTKRLAGQTRYDTAVAIAQDGWNQSDYAILAYGENYPDALSAAPLAKKYDAPILLTNGNNLPAITKETLINLQVKNVFIVGGTGVIPSSIDAELQSMKITVTRIAGQDRYDTAIKVAQQLPSPTEIFVVTGEDYPDALSIAPVAAIKQEPIILVPKDYMPDSVNAYINVNKISKTYVVGSSTDIAESVYNQFPGVERIIGVDKYARNLNINLRFVDVFKSYDVCLATGEGFADALTGAVYAAKKNLPVILVNSDSPDFIKKYYADKISNNGNVNVFGGTGVISSDAIDRLATLPAKVTLPISSSEIFNMISPSVVYIETYDSTGKGVASGSGFVVSADGKIATNYHVINGAYSAKVKTHDGKILDVTKVFAYDSVQDMALIKINASGLKPVTLGDSGNIGTGDKIYTIGNPLGLDDTMSDGLISSKLRVVNGATYIQISAPISHGSSGGVLVNEQAETIGITSAGIDEGQNLNFAIPINSLKPIMTQDINKTLAQLVGGSVVVAPPVVAPVVVPVSKMTDSQFQSYLNANYGSLTIDGLTVRFNWQMNKMTLPERDEVIQSTMDSGQYLNWLTLLNNNRKSSIQSFLSDVNVQIHNNYPNKKFFGTVIYQGYWNYYPIETFPASEISYSDYMHQWLVTHVAATIYSFDGNVTGVDIK